MTPPVVSKTLTTGTLRQVASDVQVKRVPGRRDDTSAPPGEKTRDGRKLDDGRGDEHERGMAG
jgi:hypothetical protein